MKYNVFLVSCGLLSLKVHGLSTVMPHGSEEQFPVEVDKFVDTLMRARSSEESGCSDEDSTESKDRDKCETKDNTKERPGSMEDKDLNNDLKGEFDKSIDKLLTGVKYILVDDVPLLYGEPFRCGRRFTFKCQYTTNNDTDDWFYGFETVPGPTMLRVTDAINSFVSNNIVLIFASSFDEQLHGAANGTTIDIQDILFSVQLIVDRDPDLVPEKFVCGYQVGKQMECSYDAAGDILGPELDLNDKVKRMANSKNFRRAMIKFAKEGPSFFPALRDSLADNILALLIKP